MTVSHNTRARSRFRCADRIAESFWMPSTHHGELIDAESVEWTGGSHCTAFYRCPCCGVEWAESDWPVLLMLGPGWRHRYEPPIHLVAGEGGVPRHLAGEFTSEGLLAAPTARMSA
jgi:hypothetical protein